VQSLRPVHGDFGRIVVEDDVKWARVSGPGV
jgi:hypothetical protein